MHRTLIALALSSVFGCQQTPAPNIVVEYDIHEAPPIIVIVTPEETQAPTPEPVCDAQLTKYVNEFVDMGYNEVVADDLLVTAENYTLYVQRDNGRITLPLELESAFGCAQITVEQMSIALSSLGTQDQIEGLYGLEDSRFEVVHQADDADPVVIVDSGAKHPLGLEVTDVSFQYGIEMWYGMIADDFAPLRADHHFETFEVKPETLHGLEVTFEGIDALPVGEALQMSVRIHYTIAGSNTLWYHTHQRNVTIYDPTY